MTDLREQIIALIQEYTNVSESFAGDEHMARGTVLDDVCDDLRGVLRESEARPNEALARAAAKLPGRLGNEYVQASRDDGVTKSEPIPDGNIGCGVTNYGGRAPGSDTLSSAYAEPENEPCQCVYPDKCFCPDEARPVASQTASSPEITCEDADCPCQTWEGIQSVLDEQVECACEVGDDGYHVFKYDPGCEIHRSGAEHDGMWNECVHMYPEPQGTFEDTVCIWCGERADAR